MPMASLTARLGVGWPWMISCCRFICQAMIQAPASVSAGHGMSRQKKVVRNHNP